MRNTVNFGQQGTNVTDPQMWSPAVWDGVKGCPWNSIVAEPNLGRYWIEDWKDFPLIGTQTTQIASGRYKLFNTGAGKLEPVSAINSVEIQGGALMCSLDTDNDSGSIAQSYPCWRMSGLSSNSGKLWFELIYAQKSLVTNMASVMFGLAETEQWTLATAVPLNASDNITNSASFIGYRVTEDGLGVADSVYSDRATSFTNIGAAEGGTLVAYTFRHFAMVYDPLDINECVKFFVDNVPLASVMSRAALIAMTNLDANALGWIFAACADSAGTTYEGYIRGVRIAQLNPGVNGP